MQDELSVEYDDGNSDCCEECAGDLSFCEPIGVVASRDDERCGERTGADDERDVGGGGVVERLVFGQEIECSACHSEGKHEEFVAPRIAQPSVVVASQGEGKEEDVGDDEPEGEDVCGRKPALEEQFGENEGAPPDDNGEDGDDVCEGVYI